MKFVGTFAEDLIQKIQQAAKESNPNANYVVAEATDQRSCVIPGRVAVHAAPGFKVSAFNRKLEEICAAK